MTRAVMNYTGQYGDFDGTGWVPEVNSAGSGIIGSTSFTPVAAAYSAGDLVDVAKEVSFVNRNGVLIPAGSLIRILTTVIKIDVTAVPASQTSFTGHFYDVTPPSAQADNAAWTLASADLPSYRGSIALGTPADLGAALYVKTSYLAEDMKLIGTSLFMELITVGGPTLAATAIQILLYGVLL